MVFAPHQIQKRARSGRFGLILELGVTHDGVECFPVRLKSCGSVFSSFLSYILVIDLSGLFQGVSRRFRASTDGRTVILVPNRMARWLAGGKSVKGKLSKINFYQHQTLSNIKIDQYRQLFNQQKSSQASRDGSDRASEDPRFSTFWRLVR